MAVTKQEKLSITQRLAYGVGHVLNDIAGGIWYSYLILFFQRILQFSSSMAGYVILLGQMIDAIITPLVGYESDRVNGFKKYGKRKSWHLIGSLCIVTAFPFLFMPVLGTKKADNWAKFIYYVPFVIIFTFGFATVQVSHLSLIPDLTTDQNCRVELNAIRNAFKIISNIAVYAVTWVLLDIGKNSKIHELGPQDAPTFRNLVIIMCGTGLIFTAIFHIGVKEEPASHNDRQNALKKQENKKYAMKWWQWFQEYQFYQIGILFVCTRLTFTMTQVYLPLFLTSSLQLHKISVATVPLTVYISGFIVSLFIKFITNLVGCKVTCFMGAMLTGGASCWLWFTHQGSGWQIFVACAILGAGNSAAFVTSLAMVADLIGNRTESGGFVYGFMSFVNKLSSGIGIGILQQYNPCRADASEACVWHYRNIIVILPGTLAGLTLLSLFTLTPITIGKLRKNTAHQDMELWATPDINQPQMIGGADQSGQNDNDQNKKNEQPGYILQYI